MIKLVTKYRFTIAFLIVLLALSFWFIPGQENLYLRTDFELIEKWARYFLLALIATGAIIILFMALRKVENAGQVFNVLLGVAAISISFYFVFKTFFLISFFTPK